MRINCRESAQEIEVLKEGEEKWRKENKKKLSRIRARNRGFEKKRKKGKAKRAATKEIYTRDYRR